MFPQQQDNKAVMEAMFPKVRESRGKRTSAVGRRYQGTASEDRNR
jgi:hypothetical protein